MKKMNRFKQIILLSFVSWFIFLPSSFATVSLYPEAQGVWNALGGVIFRSSAIIEAKFLEASQAFVVTKVFYGNIEEGANLNFDQCFEIFRLEPARESLTRLLNSPVVDRPIAEDWTMDLKEEEIAQFPKAKPDSRYILLLHLTSDDKKAAWRWAFVIQTWGDFFLVQNEKVFRLGYSQEPQFWAPLKKAPHFADFMSHLNAEITKRKQFEHYQQIEDPKKRLNYLANYLNSDQPFDPYVLTAIEKISKLEDGNNFLVEEVNQGRLNGYYVSEVINQLGKIKDQAHADWIQKRSRKALVLLHQGSWKFHFARENNSEEQAKSYAELTASIRALAAIGDLKALTEVHRGLFWQIAKGFQYNSYEDEALLNFLKREDTLANRALLASIEFFKKFEVYPFPSKAEIEAVVQKFAHEYKEYAVPFLLWTHKIEDMTWYYSLKDSLYKEELWNLALQKLNEIVGKDLGSNPHDWWQWYWENVLASSKNEKK